MRLPAALVGPGSSRCNWLAAWALTSNQEHVSECEGRSQQLKVLLLPSSLSLALTFQTPSEEEEEVEEEEERGIIILLRASAHFHPSPPDSSLYRCSHKSHNAPVIISPTPVYLPASCLEGGVSLSSPSSSLLLSLTSLSLFFVSSSLFLCVSSFSSVTLWREEKRAKDENVRFLMRTGGFVCLFVL